MAHYKAPNKRIIPRGAGGRFRKSTAADFGVGGTCPECRHFLIHHYDGDERTRPLDPRRFVYRCFTCQPLTEVEQLLKAEVEAGKPKARGLAAILQHTPFAVTESPPSDVTFPPLVAVVEVMEDGVVVVTVGVIVLVSNVTSLPYAVPAELVA